MGVAMKHVFFVSALQVHETMFLGAMSILASHISFIWASKAGFHMENRTLGMEKSTQSRPSHFDCQWRICIS